MNLNEEEEDVNGFMHKLDEIGDTSNPNKRSAYEKTPGQYMGIEQYTNKEVRK